MTKNVVAGFLETAVREGFINPDGKSDAELIREIRRYEFETRNSNIIWAIDHTPDLLSKARVSRGSGEFWMACLFYATWVEHHLNFMLSSVGHRHGLPDSAIKQIIRDSNPNKDRYVAVVWV